MEDMEDGNAVYQEDYDSEEFNYGQEDDDDDRDQEPEEIYITTQNPPKKEGQNSDNKNRGIPQKKFGHYDGGSDNDEQDDE